MPQSARVNVDAAHVRATPEREVNLPMPLLNGGMRQDKAEVDLAPNEAVSIENMTVLQGLMQVRQGYGEFASAYLGTAQATHQSFFADGSYEEILITTQTVYHFVTGVNQWQVLTYLLGYTTTNTVAAGVQVFPLNVVTNLANGQTMGVICTDGTQFTGKITGIAALNVTLDTPVPAGKSVANGASVARATPLNGVTDGAHQPQILTFPGNRWVIFSNCVDPIMYIAADVVLAIPNLPANTTCFGMCIAHGQLFISHTIENGTEFRYRIRGSDQADPTTWTPALSNLARIDDLLDTDDTIMAVAVLGPWIVAYRERSIMRATYLGLPNFTWLWEYMITGEGIFSQGGWCAVGATQHFLVGAQGLYLYEGQYVLESVGDPVFQGFISATGELNPAARQTTFCHYIPDFDEVWLFFPGDTDTTPRDMLRLMLEKSAWFHATLADAITAIAPYEPLASETWSTAVGIWSTDTLQWDTLSYTSNISPRLMCPASGNGPLKVFDFVALTDDTVPITWSIITRAFGDGLTRTRWDHLTIIAKGAGVTVQASVDDGVTWTTLGVVTFGTTLQPVILYFAIVSSLIMFQISGSDPTFQLRAMNVDGVYESGW